MFRRKTYDLLKHWKDTKHGTTSILIEGARRVGKSALAMEFAANEYKAHLLIDFSVAPPEVIDLFRDYRCDMDAFFRYLFAYYNFTPIPRDTLIIFDEVQLCSEARAFTKQLVADGRYDYLETGSSSPSKGMCSTSCCRRKRNRSPFIRSISKNSYGRAMRCPSPI